MSYPNTNILIICFSIDSRSSFSNITQRWLPEVKHFCPNAPFILAATKIDLRESEDVTLKLQQEGKSLITKEEYVALTKKVKAAGYCECSALQNKGVADLFDEAVRKSKVKAKSSKGGCIFL